MDALRELAGLYLAKTGEAQQDANTANVRAAYLAPGASVGQLIQLGGQPLEADAISSAVDAKLSGAVQAALAGAQQASARAVDTYRRVAAVTPNDPNAQLELAQTATDSGDYATAITAYEDFLKIAPDDPTAVEVRRLLKQLRAQSPSTG
ncbi:hypothetical protein BH20ACT14_BH20ACT14_15960 [soil metagenome]